MRLAALTAFRAVFGVLLVTSLGTFARGAGVGVFTTPDARARADEMVSASQAATEEEDAQLSARILRLMDKQIDRYLTDVSVREKERAGAQTNAQAKALVKRISKSLQPLGKTLEKLEHEFEKGKAVQAQKVAEIGRLGRELSELKDADMQEKTLTELRAENTQLKDDKGAMLKTVQELMRQTRPGGRNDTLRSDAAAQAAQARENEYENRIHDLESQLGKAREESKELDRQVAEEKQRNTDAKMTLEAASATSAELQKDKEALVSTTDSIRQEKDGLVSDKQQLMSMLRNVLLKNTDLRKKAAAAEEVLGEKALRPRRTKVAVAPASASSEEQNPETQSSDASILAPGKMAVGTSADTSRMFSDASKVLDLQLRQRQQRLRRVPPLPPGVTPAPDPAETGEEEPEQSPADAGERYNEYMGNYNRYREDYRAKSQDAMNRNVADWKSRAAAKAVQGEAWKAMR